MRYEFECQACGHMQEESFPVDEYDDRIEDGDLKDVKCESCGEIKLRRFISSAPGVLGGNSGYESMERYWSRHPH